MTSLCLRDGLNQISLFRELKVEIQIFSNVDLKMLYCMWQVSRYTVYIVIFEWLYSWKFCRVFSKIKFQSNWVTMTASYNPALFFKNMFPKSDSWLFQKNFHLKITAYTVCKFCEFLGKFTFHETFTLKFFFICDQICQKGSYACTVSSYTFHRHLLAISMYQQQMSLILGWTVCFHSGLFLKPGWHPRVLR